MGTPETAGHYEFAAARAALFTLIVEGINFGLNPPVGLRDHRTDDWCHAVMTVERHEDVMPWARALGVPVGAAIAGEPIDEPKMVEFMSAGKRAERQRYYRAYVTLADKRYVQVQSDSEYVAGGAS